MSQSDLKFRIALGNYKIFYTADTEDYFHRVARGEQEDDAREKTWLEGARKRLDEFVASKLEEHDEEPAEGAAGDAEPADVAAAAAPAAQVAAE